MGNVTISTNDTTIYYPSDWLIDGGPTFESMQCPPAEVDEDDADLPLKLIYNQRTKYFGIVQQGHIVMESKSSRDIATYFGDYVMRMREWVQEQDEINNEAERADAT